MRRGLFIVALLAVLSLGAGNPPSKQAEQAQAQEAKPNASLAPRYSPYPDWRSEACYHAKNHDSADLCAQWRAAVASEKAAHEARRATTWSIVATVLSGLAFALLVWSLLQTDSALKAAREANGIAEEAAIKDGRAWLKVTPAIAAPLQYAPESREIRTEIRLKIDNVGGSPATNVVADVRMILPDGFRSRVEAKELSEQMRGTPPEHQSPRAVIFPNDYFVVTFSISAPPERVLALIERFAGRHGDGHSHTWIPELSVIGCVQYHITGSSKPHQTNFNYRIERVPTEDWGGALVLEHLPLAIGRLRLTHSIEGAGDID